MTRVNEDHPLYASFEKIARAKRKLINLTSDFRTFLRPENWSVRGEVENKTVYVIFKLHQSLPTDFVHEITEIAGHIRESLDKLAVELVAANKRGTSGVGFPFGSEGNPFPTERHRESIEKKLPADVWALLIAQKPHPRGNETLWAINQLANASKHWRGLIGVTAYPVGSLDISPPAKGFAVQEVTFGPETRPTNLISDKKRETILFSLTADEQPDIEGTISASILFGPIAPIQGQEVISTLDRLIGEADRVVQLFGAKFF